MVVIPSLFFINVESGLPLEVVAGSANEDNLLERIMKLPLKSMVIVFIIIPIYFFQNLYLHRFHS